MTNFSVISWSQGNCILGNSVSPIFFSFTASPSILKNWFDKTFSVFIAVRGMQFLLRKVLLLATKNVGNRGAAGG